MTMQSQFRTLSEAVAASVRAALDDATGGRVRDYGLTVLVEDKLDTDFDIKQALSESGVLALVVIGGFDRKSDSANLLYGTLKLEISVVEIPSVSRASGDFLTAQTVAEIVMHRLHWLKPDGFDTPLRYRSTSRTDTDHSIVFALNFEAEVEIGEAAGKEDA